jgi:uncharacterized membrane protein YdjX (TVP38/TMEM64 family)
MPGQTDNRDLRWTAIIATAAAFLPTLGGLVLLTVAAQFAPWVKENPALGAAVVAIGFSCIAGFALLPTFSIAILSGWALGFFPGVATTMAGLVGAATVGYWLSCCVIGTGISSLVERTPKWHAVHHALLESGFWRAFGIVVLVRLTPIVPFAMTNVLMPAARVPLRAHVLGTLVGSLPQNAVLVYAASRVPELTWEVASDRWVVGIGLVATVLSVALMGCIARRTLRKLTSTSAKPQVVHP